MIDYNKLSSQRQLHKNFPNYKAKHLPESKNDMAAKKVSLSSIDVGTPFYFTV